MLRPALLVALATLVVAPLTAEARHNCGSSTKKVGNCTVTTTTLCEYRPGPGGKRQEYIIGSSTTKSCEVSSQVGPAKASSPATAKPPRSLPFGSIGSAGKLTR